MCRTIVWTPTRFICRLLMPLRSRLVTLYFNFFTLSLSVLFFRPPISVYYLGWPVPVLLFVRCSHVFYVHCAKLIINNNVLRRINLTLSAASLDVFQRRPTHCMICIVYLYTSFLSFWGYLLNFLTNNDKQNVPETDLVYWFIRCILAFTLLVRQGNMKISGRQKNLLWQS